MSWVGGMLAAALVSRQGRPGAPAGSCMDPLGKEQSPACSCPQRARPRCKLRSMDAPCLARKQHRPHAKQLCYPVGLLQLLRPCKPVRCLYRGTAPVSARHPGHLIRWLARPRSPRAPPLASLCATLTAPTKRCPPCSNVAESAPAAAAAAAAMAAAAAAAPTASQLASCFLGRSSSHLSPFSFSQPSGLQPPPPLPRNGALVPPALAPPPVTTGATLDAELMVRVPVAASGRREGSATRQRLAGLGEVPCTAVGVGGAARTSHAQSPLLFLGFSGF